MIRKFFIIFSVLAPAFIIPGGTGHGSETTSSAQLLLKQDEIKKIIRHGPWPPVIKPDPTNRFSGNAAAVTLGRRLFFETGMSAGGKTSCATCHRPEKGWTDGQKKGVGLKSVDRNTQTLFNVRFNRWFGWGGENDNLWAQSIRPITDVREMGGSAGSIIKLIDGDAELTRLYTELSGSSTKKTPGELVLVNIGKALAAFQETIISPRTDFDEFRDALKAGDWQKALAYPETARRGAAIFVGKGQCQVCHSGPHFTSGEFHDIGIPYFLEKGRVDPGRFAGIATIRSSPWTLAGKYNDDPGKKGAWASRQVLTLHRNFGEFRIPSLRNLTVTAPYMHNGSLATLEDVVRHYSEINMERIHADGEQLLKPLNLTKQEISDLVAFLETLSPAGQ